MILLRRRALTGGDMPGPGPGPDPGPGPGPDPGPGPGPDPGPGGSAAGDLLVGQTVAIKESGTPIPYLVVHQGNPDAGLYDASCEGTWLLRNEIFSMRDYGSSWFYNYSDMPDFLDPDISGSATSGLDEKIKNAMKVVQIPYHASNGVMSGANGFFCRAFLLSSKEYGNGDHLTPVDGVTLDYFKVGGAANRIAYYEGESARQWTRSDRLRGTDVWGVSENGTFISLNVYYSFGVRPAFILPYDYQFEESEVIS